MYVLDCVYNNMHFLVSVILPIWEEQLATGHCTVCVATRIRLAAISVELSNKHLFEMVLTGAGQWLHYGRNTSMVTLKIIDIRYVEKYFLDQSMQMISILKTEVLVLTSVAV